MAVHRRSATSLIELEKICQLEWEKLPRRLEAIIAAKDASILLYFYTKMLLNKDSEYYLIEISLLI